MIFNGATEKALQLIRKMFDNYLPKSGGKIERDSTVPLSLESTSGQTCYQEFRGTNGRCGYIGFDRPDVLTWIGSDGSTTRRIVHAGNCEEYTSGRTKELAGSDSLTSVVAKPALGSANLIRCFRSATGIFPTADNSNAILTVNRYSEDYISQLGFSGDGNLYYRCFSNTPINETLEWQTLLTTKNSAPVTISASAPSSGLWVVP